MSLSEIDWHLTELARGGPASVAALLIGLTLGGLGIWGVARLRSKRALDRLRIENRTLRDERDRLGVEAGRSRDRLRTAREQYREVKDRVRHRWRECEAALREQVERLRAAERELLLRLDGLTERCSGLEAQCAAAEAELAQLRHLAGRMDGVIQKRGNLWLRDVPAAAPAFVPLRQRRAPVVAVLNFKGGVGKTTLTANLAAVLAGRGERVLAIDLDYQGSLTSLLLSSTELRVAAAERRLVQDLLAAGADRGELGHYVHRLADITDTLALIPATDPLADAETWLMARWLIRPEDGDVRFTLRAALHDPGMVGKFDRVLIDCPPRLTTACVNALACCDYIVIPVILDRTSTLAAPRLLGLLREMQPVLMPGLGGVGLVADRTSRPTLIADEHDVWNELAVQCRDAWGRPVDRVPTAVPQRVAFRNAANRHRLAVNVDPEIREIFDRLADDLSERVPCESRRTPSVPR